MSSFPFMVAGPERFDTLFMEQGGGRMISKAGAEGYQGIGLLPGVLSPDSPGVGIMFKIADGDQGGRARPALATALVRMLGLLNDESCTSTEIAAMIERDSVLSGSVLRCVNSAYYGVSSRVSSSAMP